MARKVNQNAIAARKAEQEKLAKMGEQEKKIYLQQKRMHSAKKVAKVRVNRALKALRGIGELSRRRRHFTAEDITKIISAVNDAWTREAKRWASGAESSEPEFSL